jgi:hypothetical protein
MSQLKGLALTILILFRWEIGFALGSAMAALIHGKTWQEVAVAAGGAAFNVGFIHLLYVLSVRREENKAKWRRIAEQHNMRYSPRL